MRVTLYIDVYILGFGEYGSSQSIYDRTNSSLISQHALAEILQKKTTNYVLQYRAPSLYTNIKVITINFSNTHKTQLYYCKSIGISNPFYYLRLY